MALPTQIKIVLDRLYDLIQSGNNNSSEKSVIDGKVYKVRMYKPETKSDAMLVIELIDRTPAEE